jgi:hypothetical protein
MTQCHNPEDSDLQQRHCENLILCNLSTLLVHPMCTLPVQDAHNKLTECLDALQR